MASPNLFSLLKETLSKRLPDHQAFMDNPLFGPRLLSGLFILMLCLTFWGMIRRVLTYLNSYCVFTTQRIKIRFGILSHKFCQIELFRVKDIEVLQPLWGRLWNYAHVHLISSDSLSSDTTWIAMPDGVTFAEQIRSTAQTARSQTGITTIHE
jgi:hypothetical protein